MTNNQSDTRVHALIGRDEQVKQAGQQATANAEKAANLGRETVENTRKTVESGINAASHNLKQVGDQVTRTLGFSGEEGDRLARESSQNMNAVAKGGMVLGQAFQDVSREWLGLAQRQFKRQVDGMNALAGCRSVQDFAAVQSGIMRDSLQLMVDDSRRIAEISLKGAEQAGKAITATGVSAQEPRSQVRVA